MRIIVTKREGDYQAQFENDSGRWGSGKSAQAAIGDLILSHQMETRIEIVLPAEGKPRQQGA